MLALRPQQTGIPSAGIYIASMYLTLTRLEIDKEVVCASIEIGST